MRLIIKDKKKFVITITIAVIVFLLLLTWILVSVAGFFLGSDDISLGANNEPSFKIVNGVKIYSDPELNQYNPDIDSDKSLFGSLFGGLLPSIFDDDQDADSDTGEQSDSDGPGNSDPGSESTGDDGDIGDTFPNPTDPNNNDPTNGGGGNTPPGSPIVVFDQKPSTNNDSTPGSDDDSNPSSNNNNNPQVITETKIKYRDRIIEKDPNSLEGYTREELEDMYDDLNSEIEEKEAAIVVCETVYDDVVKEIEEDFKEQKKELDLTYKKELEKQETLLSEMEVEKIELQQEHLSQIRDIESDSDLTRTEKDSQLASLRTRQSRELASMISEQEDVIQDVYDEISDIQRERDDDFTALRVDTSSKEKEKEEAFLQCMTVNHISEIDQQKLLNIRAKLQ